MEDVTKEVAGLVVSAQLMLEAQKDHETRIRRIELFLAVLFGALGIYKWFVGFPPAG